MNETGSFLGWKEIDNPWTAEDESADDHTCVFPLPGVPRSTARS